MLVGEVGLDSLEVHPVEEGVELLDQVGDVPDLDAHALAVIQIEWHVIVTVIWVEAGDLYLVVEVAPLELVLDFLQLKLPSFAYIHHLRVRQLE